MRTPENIEKQATPQATTQPEEHVEKPVAKEGKKKTQVLSSFSADIFVKTKQGTFAKDYSGGRVLGEGAYGKVCLVTHKKTGIDRAMKAIKKSSVREDKEDKMLAEVSILKSLDHPNIVKLNELYQDDKYYYLVTE